MNEEQQDEEMGEMNLVDNEDLIGEWVAEIQQVQADECEEGNHLDSLGSLRDVFGEPQGGSHKTCLWPPPLGLPRSTRRHPRGTHVTTGQRQDQLTEVASQSGYFWRSLCAELSAICFAC